MWWLFARCPMAPPVALKTLHAHLLDEPIHRARFQREARTMERLRTEHTPRLLETGENDAGVPFIVMELIEGDDLWTIVRRIGPLSVEIAASYVLQVCVALGEAHALGVVHRDLKPGNLMRGRRPDGTALIKVLDFGIASPDLHESGFDANRTEPDAFLGSYNYMSPEQLQSPRGVDPRSDIWALGGILHFLLTGAAPFAAPSAAETVTRILHESPRLEPFVERAIPADLCAVVLRCLEKSPAARFSRAIEVARALAPFCGGGGARLGTDRKALFETQRMTMSPIPQEARQEAQNEARAPSVPPTTVRMVTVQPAVEVEAAEAPPTPAASAPAAPLATDSTLATRRPVSAPQRESTTRQRGGAPAFLSVSFLALMLGGTSGALWKGVSGQGAQPAATLSGHRLQAVVASTLARETTLAARQTETPSPVPQPAPPSTAALDTARQREAAPVRRVPAAPAAPKAAVAGPPVEPGPQTPSSEVGQRSELRDPYAEEPLGVAESADEASAEHGGAERATGSLAN
jgi:serine/threonine protein kinase